VAIEFLNAPTVAVGDELTSTQHNALARAFNSRITSPFDVAWRIAWYLDSATKQVSATIGDNNEMPARDEFTKIFGHYLQSDHGSWPDPGIPNRASCPIMKFVYGDPSLGSEDDRLDVAASWLPVDGLTPEQLWQLGKLQRGFVDLDHPESQFAAPAITAAQEYFKIIPNTRGKYLVSFGGFIPTPLPTGDLCGDPDESEVYDIFFTSLEDGSVEHFTGFCPDNSDGATVAGAIKGLSSGPFSWTVYFHDGARAPESFLRSEWVLGPFTGPGRLSHGPSDFIGQAVNRYLSTFRGSEAERTEPGYDAKRAGFDFQEFLASQYLLAPSRGTLSGSFIDEMTTSHTANGPTIAAGSLLTGAIDTGYVFGGLFVKATGLTSLVVIQITVGTAVAAVVTVTPESPTAYVYSREGLSGAFTLTNVSAATTSAGGSLYIEILELQDYKPGIHDAYLVLRLGSAPSAMLDSGQTDGDAFSSPKSISDGYFTHGLIFNTGSTGLSPIGETDAAASAFIESARRVAIDNLRMVSGVNDQNQIVKYAVEGGKSVLWLERHPMVNDARDTDADIFRELAPMRRESGEIQADVIYDVQDFGIEYNDTFVTAGSSFTGIYGVTTFENPSGVGWVRERDGIKTTAPKQGWSNEWVMVPTWIHGPRNTAAPEQSIWKEEAFAAPLVGFNNPCLVNSDSLHDNRGYRTHYNYGLRPILKAEAPSGHNYPGGLGVTGDNGFDAATTLPLHFASCQIYQRPYEVESCVMDGALVKMTFTTRFRRHSTAPSGDISDNVLGEGWNVQRLVEEDYQTDEGRIQKFLILRALGTVPLTTFGDAAYDGLAALQRFTDDPSAAVLPKFYFVRQIQLAYEDCNEDADPEDSPVTVETMLQMELYARPMCEAFVDSATSIASDCELGGIDGARLYDFTFENAMVQAAGPSWMQTLPTAIVGENVKGYGPLPRTQFYASIFNQFANFINLLTRARIDVPLVLQQRTHTTEGFAVASTYYNDGALPAVSGGPDLFPPSTAHAALWDGLAPFTGTTDVTTDWTETLPNAFGQIGFSASKVSILSSDWWIANGANYAWASKGFSISTEWRVDPDSMATAAMSDELQELVNSSAGLLVQQYEDYTISNPWNLDAIGSPIDSLLTGFTFPLAGVYLSPTITNASPVTCFISSGGTVEAPIPPSGRSSVQVRADLAKAQSGGTGTLTRLTIAGLVDQDGRITTGQGNVFVDVPVVDYDPCDP